MRYELFGYKPEKGQWRWEETRAKQAEKNYKEYMEMHSDIKTLDQWYVENIQNNKNLDFVRLSDDGVAQYYVAPQSYRLVSDNWLDIPATGNITDFPHEKSLALLRRIIEWNCNPGDFVCDFFAGSGSTAHAAIRSKDNGAHSYRYVVVEAGKHFDEVLKPRLVRYTYASEYSGKGPMRQDGLSVLKKYIRLESYEDCLDNLSLSRTAGQQQLLDQHDRLREEYMLHYMVDVETEGSLLDTRSFDRPFDYTLSVVRDDEPFNYLLGLRVKTRDRKRGVLEIIGLSPEGEMVLVLWRNVDEVDSDALDEWFRKQGYNSRDLEFQTIYINGDNNIENQRQTDETWKVRLIEEHFHKLMFDVEGM
jgi:adenine-specific DNA-methyltransferase